MRTTRHPGVTSCILWKTLSPYPCGARKKRFSLLVSRTYSVSRFFSRTVSTSPRFMLTLKATYFFLHLITANGRSCRGFHILPMSDTSMPSTSSFMSVVMFLHHVINKYGTVPLSNHYRCWHTLRIHQHRGRRRFAYHTAIAHLPF